LLDLLHVRSSCDSSEDPYLAAAERSGKKILFLQPRASLPELVDDDRDGRELKIVLSDRDYAAREDTRMRSAYRGGDATSFIDASEPLRGRLAEQRGAWTMRLAELARHGPIFVELPVSQLVGPVGVLSLLTRMGYTVTRR
jgi:hypothetical protein